MDNGAQDNDAHGRIPSQVFCCYAPDLRPLAILLSSVHFSARATIQISKAGFHVQVEIDKILLAHAYLEKSAFTEWHFNPPRLPDSQKFYSSSDDVDHDGHPSGSNPKDKDEDEELSDVKFEISMISLIECLNVFGTATSQKTFKKNFLETDSVIDHQEYNTTTTFHAGPKKKLISSKSKSRKQPASAVRISYNGEGHPLVLLIEDSGVITRCALVTYEAEELAPMDFDRDRQVVHLIMKSDWLKSAFSQFDDKSGTEITFTFSPPPPPLNRPPLNQLKDKRNRHQRGSSHNELGTKRPTFRIEVDGELGRYTIDFPNDRDILDNYECKIPEDLDPDDFDQLGFVRNSYKLSHILKSKKALDVSNKVSLRVDDTGFLSLQLLIPLEESTTLKTRCGYVEFLCVPIED